MRGWAHRALLALAVMLLPQAAAAATCSATVSNINFGAISVRAGAVNQTSGTVTVTCRGALVSVVGVCLYFGPGSGGAGANNAPRYMRRGDGAGLAYQLRPLGNGAAFGTLNAVYVPVATVLGAGSATVPVFADVTSASVAVGSGSYQSVFNGPGDILMQYGELTTCSLLPQGAQVPPFTVSAEVVPSCELDVGALAFGSISSRLNNPVDAAATVNVRCTSDTSYSISLGGGENGSGTARAMRSGANTLNYGLFQDAARTMPWGDLPGNRRSATGTGANSSFTVHGRIPAGQNPAVGVYTDNVVVTITY